MKICSRVKVIFAGIFVLLAGMFVISPMLGCGGGRQSARTAPGEEKPPYVPPSSAESNYNYAPAPVQITPSHIDYDGGSTDILVWGRGANVELARQDAFRQAVEKVVGIYLDAVTLSRNRQIVEDEIFRLANGFVERYEIVKEDNRQNEVIGQYRVWVRNGRISSEIGTRVSQNRIIVDMEQIVASGNSELARNQQISSILTRFLSDHPQKSLTVTVVGFELAEPVGITNNVTVNVDVALQWNQIWLYRFASFLQYASVPGTPVAIHWVEPSEENRSPLRSGYLARGLQYSAQLHSVQYSEQLADRSFSVQPMFSVDAADVSLPTAIIEDAAWNIGIFLQLNVELFSRGRSVSRNNYAIPIRFPGKGIGMGLVSAHISGESPHLLIASPTSETLGLGKVYRVKLGITLETLNTIDDIRANLTRR